MKKKRLISLLLCVCFIVFQFPAVASAEGERVVETESTTYALCIGVDQYGNMSEEKWLEGCVNDANYMADTLKTRAGVKEENLKLLTDSQATNKNIREIIQGIADNAEPGDVFIMHNSSHGYSYTVDNDYTIDTGICNYDEDYDDDELAADLLKFKKGVKVIVIIDACHSSGLFKTEEDNTDDNDRKRDGKEINESFDIAERVSAIMDEMEANNQTRDSRGISHISSSDIGWVTAADYYQYSYDGGYYDADDWMFTGQTKTGENLGGVFTAAFIWSWWNGKADFMNKGDGDGYFDAYEGWGYARTVCAEWGYTSCCKNIDVLRSVELGYAGDLDVSRDVLFKDVPASTAKIGENVMVGVSAYNPEGVDGEIQLSIVDSCIIDCMDDIVGECNCSFENGVIEFTPQDDGYYIFNVRATNKKSEKYSDKIVCVSVFLDAPVMLETTDIGCRGFTLNWKEVSGGEGYEILIVDNSLLHIDTAESFKSDLVEGTSYTADKLKSDQIYYAKVRAINNAFGEWSEVTKVKTTETVDPVVTAPVAKTNIKYNGSKQALITEGKVSGGTFKYAVVGPCAKEPEYDEQTVEKLLKTEIPSAKEAGTYWVYYYVQGDALHNDLMEKTPIKVVISPKTVTAPTIILEKDFYVYDGKAKKPSVTVKDGSLVIPSSEYNVSYSNNTAVGNATVTITDKADGNYIVSGNKKFIIGNVGVEWFWNSSYGAVAYFTSSNYSAFSDSVKGKVTNKIIKQPTLNAAGKKTYTATVTYNGKSYTDTKDETLYLFDKSLTGIQKYNNVLYYVKKGVQDTTFTGIAKYGSDWYYVAKGKVDTSKKDVVQGTVNGESGWWFVSGGKVQFIDSVEQNSNGWWVIRKGKVNFNYTGLAKNSNGTWYCKGGKVDFTKKDVVKGKVDGVDGWWYVSGGKVQLVDSVEKNSNGWWVIQKGKVNFNYTGFAKNSNGWWYCKGGKVDFTKKDVIKGKVNGVDGWWFVSGGKVQLVNSVEKNSNGWWVIQKGKVNFDFTGLANNSNGWWYCKGGKVDFNFNGIAKNQYGQWYCKGGKVQFDYNGTVNFYGKTYKIKGGKVVD
ncbi:MAG: caspase family protein [Eubacterium sp.]|nr:caspase family protein [Eubacterium sp.]